MILNFKEKWMAPEIFHGVIVRREKDTRFIEKICDGIKKHSIRIDKKGRWKSGSVIHMATGGRTGRYKCHAIRKCTGTQSVSIKYGGFANAQYSVYVDNRRLTESEVEQLAYNDGFDDVRDFLNWFKDDFHGKIIHWTRLRY
ncbi:MAG: hypothetical protein LBL04_02065 [Bacteroidales bacterium]|jgi:hypothetical protein|nr:hypothetical protein [Bacteroidales bacterium]